MGNTGEDEEDKEELEDLIMKRGDIGARVVGGNG